MTTLTGGAQHETAWHSSTVPFQESTSASQTINAVGVAAREFKEDGSESATSQAKPRPQFGIVVGDPNLSDEVAKRARD